MQHVNNVTSLQWCLDIAEAHWMSKASEAIRKKYAWVVLNHFISYKAPAFEGDELEIETWIVSHEGVKSQRNYKIIRIKDARTIVEASTTWCLLDGKTHKPLKIPQEIRTLFS
jgi:acyl-CoA thioester hydrolase